jgi:hypothetical protein
MNKDYLQCYEFDYLDYDDDDLRNCARYKNANELIYTKYRKPKEPKHKCYCYCGSEMEMRETGNCGMCD